MGANEHGKPDLETVRARLLERAAELGLRGDDDAVIEQLLEREVPEAEPGDEECRRYYDANLRRFTAGALVEASHILFAMTSRVPPERLRAKAAEVHALATRSPERFAELAREYSNCPSAAQGGSLGQLARGDSVPEFEKEVLDGERLGVLPDLVASRFGFHVVLVARRIPGRALPYGEAKAEVAQALRRLGAERAIAQYVTALGLEQPRR